MDKYDEAIIYLKLHPKEIPNAWSSPSRHKAGALFQMLGYPGNSHIGCPTMIKGGNWEGATEEITQMVRNNPKIPSSYLDITEDCFEAFAEIQRETDKIIKRD